MQDLPLGQEASSNPLLISNEIGYECLFLFLVNLRIHLGELLLMDTGILSSGLTPRRRLRGANVPMIGHDMRPPPRKV